jgi:ABC-type branched-subunit amino acid transport system ATPase component
VNGRALVEEFGPSTAAALTLSEVVVDFGGVRALDHVNLDVEPGSIVGLIGANGSGKTTLLDVISGFVAPTNGAVAVDGRDLVDDLPEERAAIGVVRSFQDCRLFPELTVQDTLMLTVDARLPVGVIATTLGLPGARRTEAEKRAKVAGVIDTFSLGRFRDHRIGELSTGTRRVVDLASIILAGPRLLLLDEPTAGIAQREAEAFIPLLRRMHDVTGATIVLVEHDVPLVFELCSNVVVMQLGSVVAAGPPDVVRHDPRALAAYLGASDEAIFVSGPHTGAAVAPTPGGAGAEGDVAGVAFGDDGVSDAAAAGGASDPAAKPDGGGSALPGAGPEPLP